MLPPLRDHIKTTTGKVIQGITYERRKEAKEKKGMP